ncbi:hypothetical protein BEI67_19090 [Photobacterium damselae subsp. piscicida]|nr:hypothetical protein BEI67_19090 [Photobacterium damselae subsp. piscicida]
MNNLLNISGKEKDGRTPLQTDLRTSEVLDTVKRTVLCVARNNSQTKILDLTPSVTDSSITAMYQTDCHMHWIFVPRITIILFDTEITTHKQTVGLFL